MSTKATYTVAIMKDELYREGISARVDTKTLRFYEKLAAKQRRPISQVVRIVLEDHMDAAVRAKRVQSDNQSRTATHGVEAVYELQEE